MSSLCCHFFSLMSSSRYSFPILSTLSSLARTFPYLSLITLTSFPTQSLRLSSQLIHSGQCHIYHLSLFCYMPGVPVILSTFFFSLTIPLFKFLTSSFEYFLVLHHSITKSPCLLSFVQRMHQIPCGQVYFLSHLVTLA